MQPLQVEERESTVRSTGVGRLLIMMAMFLSVVLGAFLHSRFGGKTLPPPASNAIAAESAKAGRERPSPDVVQISPASQKDVGIAVEPAAMRSLQGWLSATGVVTEDPVRVAHIRTLARGLIERTFVKLGDRVSAGSPLVEYDNIELGVGISDYRGAQAELLRSLTDLEVKTKILERSRAMLAVGAVAQTTHDLREAEVKDAEARAVGARANVSRFAEQIRRFGWTDQDLAKLPLDQPGSGHTISHTIVKAPFAGVVTSHHAVGSEAVEQGTELLAITDMSSLWVLADVYEKDLAQIRNGQAVRARVASYPGQTFDGKITNISDVIDPKTRTAKVRCVVANEGGLLKLEMFATVEIPVGQTRPTLAVPTSSIQQIDGRTVVFVRTSEREFQRREVQTGVESEGYSEIRSGLKEGEVVASRGSFVVKTAFLKDLIGGEE